MKISCIWEHNGDDTLLHAVELPGAYTRGADLQTALAKMEGEVRSWMLWAAGSLPYEIEVEVIRDASCKLEVRDCDSDLLFECEKAPIAMDEYLRLKALALRSAEDFQKLFDSIPEPDAVLVPPRKTFYGGIPSTARQMYEHTRNVNDYYFGEIDVPADHEGDIVSCRVRGFEELEKQKGFLENPVIAGSYGESWTLRKVIRRFIWHDRIHGKAMYRRWVSKYGGQGISDPFCFGELQK